MACTELQKIKIGKADIQGGKDKEDLKNCYFCPTGRNPAGNNTYAFYARDNAPVATGITSGSSFSFSLPGILPGKTIVWTIPNPDGHPFHIDDQDAHGSWCNDDTSLRQVGGDVSSGESGTFSAQAGGGIDPEEAYRAKA